MSLDRVILALDFKIASLAKPWIRAFAGKIWGFKVGLELFVSEGPKILEEIRTQGGRAFLDLKLHDIPNTVEKTCRAIAAYDVQMITVHALGGAAMIRAASDGLAKNPEMKLIAVTILTSHTQESLSESRAYRAADIPVLVADLAMMSLAAGAHGVVCSALEVCELRKKLGSAAILVTPGIRFGKLESDDQRRTMGGRGALALGSSLLVIGRAITALQDPQMALDRLVQEFIS